VTTLPLKERFSTHASNIIVIPNNLDERLLIPRFQRPEHSIFPKKRFIIGMMGTYTHDDDLLMVLPAMKEIHEKYPGKVEFQFIGSILREETREQLSELTVHFMRPKAEEGDYPYFLLWFTSQVRWDIALSPLQSTPFNQYKSDIKFLDYCSIGAVGVFSRIPVYEGSVQDRVTGRLVDNESGSWYQAFEECLEDEGLRLSISKGATQYLYSERILAHNYQNWIEALQSV
jgi:glycosyltransferase involved in cell wall biosynthesis